MTSNKKVRLIERLVCGDHLYNLLVDSDGVVVATQRIGGWGMTDAAYTGLAAGDAGLYRSLQFAAREYIGGGGLEDEK